MVSQKEIAENLPILVDCLLLSQGSNRRGDIYLVFYFNILVLFGRGYRPILLNLPFHLPKIFYFFLVSRMNFNILYNFFFRFGKQDSDEILSGNKRTKV
jgi:hypothetical protein